ncbi:MAG: RlmE family RNA methyltransferase [Proteobacteria bacterium]|nr:RlmE family RNA methyltransferase [Pseudomonadota bacterium]
MKKVRDHYFKKAKQEGYAARSAYKLQEIDQKYHLIKTDDKVLDLGCFPGSWLQYISRKIGRNGIVVGIDRTELKIRFEENMRFVHSDIDDLDSTGPEISDLAFDLVCSDMAPNTTGIGNVDSERSLQLCLTALDIAQHCLKKGGTTLVKIFQGASFERLIKRMRQEYGRVKIVKPKSSRNESKEIFVLGIKKT